MIKKSKNKESKAIQNYIRIIKNKKNISEKFEKLEYNGSQYEILKPYISSKGYAYNSSIIKYKDKKLLAYRHDINNIKKIFICELNNKFIIKNDDKTLKLKTKEIIKPNESRFIEDPRLWTYNGNLYCSYTVGLKYQKIGFCLLDNNYNTIQHYNINYGDKIEKNWQFFQYKNNLYIIYSIHPNHKILKINSNLEISDIYETKTNISHNKTICGGTPPILYDNIFWSFYHDREEIKIGRNYGMGLYCFEPKPPFKIIKIYKPFLHGNLWGGEKRINGHSVIFPCGSFIEDGFWYISVGYNDIDTRILRIKHKDIIS